MRISGRDRNKVYRVPASVDQMTQLRTVDEDVHVENEPLVHQDQSRFSYRPI